MTTFEMEINTRRLPTTAEAAAGSPPYGPGVWHRRVFSFTLDDVAGLKENPVSLKTQSSTSMVALLVCPGDEVQAMPDPNDTTTWRTCQALIRKSGPMGAVSAKTYVLGGPMLDTSSVNSAYVWSQGTEGSFRMWFVEGQEPSAWQIWRGAPSGTGIVG